MNKKSKKQTYYNSFFASRLRRLREEKKVSQEDVCKAVGIKQRASLSQYENGEVLPKIDVFVNLATYYDVSFEFLLGTSANKKQENITIGDNLGLYDESIELLKKLSLKKKNNRKNYLEPSRNSLFAINQLLKFGGEELFEKIGDFLLIPNKENPHLKNIEFDKYYSYLDYDSYFEKIDFDIEYYKLFKSIERLFYDIKNSENVALIFEIKIKQKSDEIEEDFKNANYEKQEDEIN